MEKDARKLSVDIHVLANCAALISLTAEASRLAEEAKYWNEVLGRRGTIASLCVYR